MKFLNLEAQNFMSFKFLEFDFPQADLYFVGGNVEEGSVSSSNGAGKSAALCEALSFGLYGKTIRNVGKDEVVNWDVKKNCFVSVCFEDDLGEEYNVIRFRNDDESANNLYLFKGDDDLSGEDSYATQETIDSILKMNWLVFSTAVVFGEKAQRFTEARDSVKKEIFDEILMLHVYRDAQKKVKDDIKEVDDQIGSIQFALGGETSKLKEIVEELEVIEAQLKETKVKKDELKEKIMNAEIELDSDLEAKKDIEEKYNGAKRAVDELSKEGNKLHDIMRRYEEERTVAEKEAAQTHFEAHNAFTIIENKIDELQVKVMNIDKLPDNERCPTCGRFVNDESKTDVHKHFEEELKKLQKKAEPLDEANEKTGEAERAVVAKHKKKINVAEKTRHELDKTLAERNEEALALRSEVSVNENSILLRRRDIASLKHERDETGSKLLENKRRFIEKRNKCQAAIEGYQGTLQIAIKKTKHLKFWVEGFGNTGIKSLLLDEIIPELNTRVGYFAAALMDNQMRIEFDTQTELKSGESRDKFDVKIYLDDKRVDYKSCSSGEKGRIDAAILLALQNLIFGRTAETCGTVIFDEIFEHLDIIGIERIVNLLKEEAKDKSIFVISHQQELQDYFDNSLIITKRNGISSLEA